MAPDSKAELQMMMMQQREQMQFALKDMTIENQRSMLAQRTNAQNDPNKGADWSIEQIDDPNKPGSKTPVRINKMTGEVVPLEGAGGLSKIGSPPKPESQPNTDSVQMLKSYLNAGLNPPSYMARGAQGQADLREAMSEIHKEGGTGASIAGARADVRAKPIRMRPGGDTSLPMTPCHMRSIIPGCGSVCVGDERSACSSGAEGTTAGGLTPRAFAIISGVAASGKLFTTPVASVTFCITREPTARFQSSNSSCRLRVVATPVDLPVRRYGCAYRPRRCRCRAR
jgi:hypothetical protein